MSCIFGLRTHLRLYKNDHRFKEKRYLLRVYFIFKEIMFCEVILYLYFQEM